MFYIATDSGLYKWNEQDYSTQLMNSDQKPVKYLVSSKDGQSIDALNPECMQLERTADGKVEPQSVMLDADKTRLYLGTNPPAIYERGQNGNHWFLVCDLTRLSFAKEWYTPWGGTPAVRSMAPKPDAPGNFYANIHVGGIIKTSDGGHTWEQINNGLELDVHQVATNISAPNRVYAATANGFYLSENQGNTWIKRNCGLHNLYTRGIAIHANNPDIILLSGSPTSPPGWRGENGAQFSLFYTCNGGLNWEQINDGFGTSIPDVIDTNCIAFSMTNKDAAMFSLHSGVIFASDNYKKSWRQVAHDLPTINSIYAA